MAVVAIVAVLVPAGSALGQDTRAEATRFAGADRFATSALIAPELDTSDTVYLATGHDFADALSAGVLAGLTGSPVLLAPSGDITDPVRTALVDADPTEVVLLGGSAALGDAVADTARSIVPDADVRRLAGSTRFATAVAVADEIGDRVDGPVEEVVVANATTFADALAVAPLAVARQAPLVLVGADVVPEPSAAYLDGVAADRVTVVGGPAVVSDAVAAEVGMTERIAGADRWATSREIAERVAPQGADTVVLASGMGFADALAGGPLAADVDAPVVLTANTTVTDDTASALAHLRPSRLLVLGGTAAITDPVVDEILGNFVPASPADEREPSTPAARPTEVIATGQDERVELTWQPNPHPDTTGYIVSQAASPQGPWTQLTSEAVADTTFTATELTNGDTYYFTVTTETGEQTSEPSRPVPAVPGATIDAPFGERTSAVAPDAVRAIAPGPSEDTLTLSLDRSRHSPQAGDHLVVEPTDGLPDGLIATVAEVTHPTPDEVEVVVGQASLDRAFPSMTMDIDVPFTFVESAADAPAPTASAQGSTTMSLTSGAFDCKDQHNDPIDWRDAWESDFSFPVELDFERTRAHHHFDAGSPLTGRDPLLILQLSGDAVASVSAQAKTEFSCELSTAYRRSHRLRATIGYISGVPITINLEPMFTFGVSGEASVGFSQRHSWSATAQAADGEPLAFDWAYSNEPLELDADVRFSAEIFGGGDLSVMFGHELEAGMFAAFGPSFLAEAGSDNPDCVVIRGMFRADFGVRLTLWVKRWDLEFAEVTVGEAEYGRRCGLPPPDSEPDPDPEPNPDPDPRFVTTWDTSKISGTEITLPFHGDVDVDIDWGDGTTDNGVTGEVSHAYVNDGTYTITVDGTFERYGSFDLEAENGALLSVETWGETKTTSLNAAFRSASNLRRVAEPPTTVTKMRWMFSGAAAFDQAIGHWDTSNVTGMGHLFDGARSFNQPIGDWDTSNVTDMRETFFAAGSFDQPIGNWDTRNVRDMRGMFDGARSFNQPIGDWDTRNVTQMRWMFTGAAKFDQPIGDWDTSNVTGMGHLFDGARSFNQPIGDWDTSNVTDMRETFFAAGSFDQPIGDWDTSNVTHMRGMFEGAAAFNADLSRWCVAQIQTKPRNFDAGATSWFLPRPEWGACPSS